MRRRDHVSVKNMHIRANLLSLEQRRQVQTLCLMFIYKGRHDDVRRVHNRRTRAAEVYSFARERYSSVKYKNIPYYKGSLLWDSFPADIRNSLSLLEFKRKLKMIYKEYTDVMTQIYVEYNFVFKYWIITIIVNRYNYHYLFLYLYSLNYIFNYITMYGTGRPGGYPDVSFQKKKHNLGMKVYNESGSKTKRSNAKPVLRGPYALGLQLPT